MTTRRTFIQQVPAAALAAGAVAIPVAVAVRLCGDTNRDAAVFA